MDQLPTKIEVSGQTYGIEITDWDARKLRPIGFDVYNFTGEETMGVLFGRSPILADVLLHFCQPKDEESFLRGLNSQVMEAAREALKNAIVNFTPAVSRQSVLDVYSEITKALTSPSATASE